MANQPHPSRQAVTWRLPRMLVDAVRVESARRGETMLAFVMRALHTELDRVTAGHDVQVDSDNVRVLTDLDVIEVFPTGGPNPWGGTVEVTPATPPASRP